MINACFEEYMKLHNRLKERYKRVREATVQRDEARKVYQEARINGYAELEGKLWVACEGREEALVKATNEYHAVLESYCLYVMNNEDALFKPGYIRSRRRSGTQPSFQEKIKRFLLGASGNKKLEESAGDVEVVGK